MYKAAGRFSWFKEELNFNGKYKVMTFFISYNNLAMRDVMSRRVFYFQTKHQAQAAFDEKITNPNNKFVALFTGDEMIQSSGKIRSVRMWENRAGLELDAFLAPQYV